jgi:hypothetical protein
MSIEHPTPGAALDSLRAALTQLRGLAAAPSADPFYMRSADQVAAIVAGIEGREAGADPAALAPPSQGPDPVPPNPG